MTTILFYFRLREQNAIDVIIRDYHPCINKHDEEKRIDDDNSSDWDTDDLALLNAEDPDMRNAELERIGQIKKLVQKVQTNRAMVNFI